MRQIQQNNYFAVLDCIKGSIQTCLSKEISSKKCLLQLAIREILIKPSLFTSSRTKEASQSACQRSLCDVSLIHVPLSKPDVIRGDGPGADAVIPYSRALVTPAELFPQQSGSSVRRQQKMVLRMFFSDIMSKREQLPARDERIFPQAQSQSEPGTIRHNDHLVDPASGLASLFSHRTDSH